jgi:SWI/SNF-related matrix-associated actin-dependent regulator 1 of chromatin subfamily A
MKYVTYYDGLFRWRGPYDLRLVPKYADWWWNVPAREWQTADHKKALKLQQYFDAAAEEEIRSWEARQRRELEESRSVKADIEIPCPPGLNYLDYQKAGVAYAVRRDGTLIADEMGLGKTIQAIGLMNYLGGDCRNVLVICPATLKINWQRELEKWLVFDRSIGIVDGKTGWRDEDIIIVNYDLLDRFTRELRSRVWDVVVLDEAHYIKNPEAKRTVAVTGKRVFDMDRRQWVVLQQPVPGKKRLLLTGTPIYNRPQDLWTIVDYCLSDVPISSRFKHFQSKGTFWKRYAGYTQTRHGWEFTGPMNLDELQEQMRVHMMIRRLKSQVLTELPPKIRQVVELDARGASSVIKAEYEHARKKQDALIAAQAEMEIAKATGDDEAYRAAVKKLRQAHSVAFEEMAKIRHEVGLATAKAALGCLEDAVESSGKLVIFAHHRDVIELIENHLTGKGCKVVKVVGGMSSSDKQAAVDSFQQKKGGADVFIGSITAAGVGITLTASSHVVFVELDWVPANIEQGEDRCHRIGQEQPVLVQHLVLEGSLTARIAQTIVEKQETNRKALDNKGAGTEEKPEFLNEPIVPAAVDKTESAPSAASTVLTPRQRLQQEGESMTDEQRRLTRSVIRFIAGLCDRARNLDDVGFNKLDSAIGHRLAQTPDELWTPGMHALAKVVCRKYRRQIVEGLGSAVYEGLYGPGSATPSERRKRNPELAEDELDSKVMSRGM